MKGRIFWFCIMLLPLLRIHAQDIVLFQKNGILASTRSYPGLMLDKKFNISLPGIQAMAMTDGPTANQLTSTNSRGERYFNLENTTSALSQQGNIYGNLDIHTFDIGVRLKSYSVLAGHSFRRQGNMRYSLGLPILASEGNAGFIGQTIQIGAKADVQAYNEFYLGVQKSFGKLSMGIRTKLLYGTASLFTERASALFTTREANYAFELQNDYLVRSSGLLRYYSLDSITVSNPGFTFDNLFYNNAGIGVDIGAVYTFNDRLTLAVSALDIGKIQWDFYPREYKSKGTFLFEGLDLAQFIGDTTGIQVDDTLLQIVQVNTGQKVYSTSLPFRFLLAASYQTGPWTVNGQWCMRSVFGDWVHELSFAGLRRFGPATVGLQCMVGKNQDPSRPAWISGLGGFLSIRKGPFYGYISSDGLPGLLKPWANRRAGISAGCSVQF